MSANAENSRLYIEVPDRGRDELADTQKQLERFSARLDVACVNLPAGLFDTRSAPSGDQAVSDLVTSLQRNTIAVLADLDAPQYLENRKSFEKALENARNAGLDGIHIGAHQALFERARQVLDPNTIIGCNCGTSKHSAMLLGEAGADYIGFDISEIALHERGPDDAETTDAIMTGTDIELVAWWQEMFEVPCLASGITERAQIEALLQIPADFIAIGPALWPALCENGTFLSWLSSKCPMAAKVA